MTIWSHKELARRYILFASAMWRCGFRKSREALGHNEGNVLMCGCLRQVGICTTSSVVRGNRTTPVENNPLSTFNIFYASGWIHFHILHIFAQKDLLGDFVSYRKMFKTFINFISFHFNSISFFMIWVFRSSGELIHTR